MSNRETYSEIHATLDSFKAPAGAAMAIPPRDLTISERIRGLVGPAAAALHEAGFVVGDGTLAEAIVHLAKSRQDANAIVAQLTRDVIAEQKVTADARKVLSAYLGDDDGTLAEAAERLVALRLEAVHDASVAEGLLAEKHLDERHHVAHARPRSAAEKEAAEKEAAETAAEIVRLRADVERLSNQLDYATELCLAGFRQ